MRGAERGEDKGNDLHEPRVDADGDGRLLAAAHEVHVVAQLGAVQDDTDRDRQAKEPNELRIDAKQRSCNEVDERVGWMKRNRTPLRDPAQATHHHHRAERDEDRHLDGDETVG